jgi:hypothetical protein
MSQIQQVSRDDYDVRGLDKGGSMAEIAWYATEDNKALGVVLSDMARENFSWMVFTENDQGPGYSGVDLGVDVENEEEAMLELHDAMLAEIEIQRLKNVNR